MNESRNAWAGTARAATAGAVSLLASLAATAQPSNTTPSATTPSTSAPPSTTSVGPGLNVQSGTSPYYIGINQALTHDSNVYRIPSGPSDNFSSTSLLAGFDQPISRQRVFGSASVSVNRYQEEDRLNNTSYSLNAGLDWETIEHLSGNVNTSIGRSLTAPTALAGAPTPIRNTAQTRNFDATARWGGVSLLTLEGTVGWSRVDYSAPESVQSESSQSRGGLTLYYAPGGPLRVGVGGHVVRSRTPQGVFDPATGTFVSTTSTARSADLHADYRLTGILSTSARLSYTKQTSSGAGDLAFSGLTGSLSVAWQPTGKTSLNLLAARDAGFDASTYSTVQIVNNNGVLTFTPITGQYENNRVTDSLGLSASHATTAKISTWANARYSRAKLATAGVIGSSGAETVDVAKIASLGANYSITRAWSLACSVAKEWRDVTGGAAFSYTAHIVSCATQFTLR
jgi:hypothetical protein